MKGGCPFELLDGERIAVEEPITKSKNASVKLSELLDHLGFAAGGPLVQKRGNYFLPLFSKDRKPAGQLRVAFIEFRINNGYGFTHSKPVLV
jgi:hypothetical protein